MSLVGPLGVPLAVNITLAAAIADVDNVNFTCNDPIAFTSSGGIGASLTTGLSFNIGDGPKIIYVKSTLPGTYPIHWEATQPYFVDAFGALQKTHDSFDVTFINSPQFQFKGTMTGIPGLGLWCGLATLDVPSGHTISLTWSTSGASVQAFLSGGAVGINGPFVGPCHVDFYSGYAAGIQANITGIAITANDGVTTYSTSRDMITCVHPAASMSSFVGNPVTPSGSLASIPVTTRGFAMGTGGSDLTNFSPYPGTATITWSVSITPTSGTITGSISGTPCVVPGGQYAYAPAAETATLSLSDDSGMAPMPGGATGLTDLVTNFLTVFYQALVST